MIPKNRWASQRAKVTRHATQQTTWEGRRAKLHACDVDPMDCLSKNQQLGIPGCKGDCQAGAGLILKPNYLHSSPYLRRNRLKGDSKKRHWCGGVVYGGQCVRTLTDHAIAGKTLQQQLSRHPGVQIRLHSHAGTQQKVPTEVSSSKPSHTPYHELERLLMRAQALHAQAASSEGNKTSIARCECCESSIQF